MKVQGITVGTVIMLLGSFSGGFLVGHFVPIQLSGNQSPFSSLPETVPTITTQQQSSTPDDLNTLFQPFWEAWNIVHDEYVDQPVNDVTLMQGALSI